MEDAVEIAVARLPGCSSIQASNNLKQIPSARKRCLRKNLHSTISSTKSVATRPELWFSGKRIPPSHNHFLYTRIIFKFSWFWHHGNVLIFPTLRLVCYTFGRKDSKSEVQKVIDLQNRWKFFGADFLAQPFVDGTSCEVVESKPLVGSSAKSNKGCATNSIPLATQVSLQEFMVIFSESPCYIQNVQSYTCWWTHNILKVQKRRRRQHIQEIVRYLKNDSGIGFMKCCLWLLKVCTFKGYVTKLLDSCQPFVKLSNWRWKLASLSRPQW